MDTSGTSSVGDSNGEEEPGAAQLAVALTPKQRIALDALSLGVSPAGAADKAGVHRGTVSRWLLTNAHFIAALNALQLELITAGNARLLALIPAALATVEDAIENGNATLAMQILKASVLSRKSTGSLSSKMVAEQIRLAEKQKHLDLLKQLSEIESQYEASMETRHRARKQREWREHVSSLYPKDEMASESDVQSSSAEEPEVCDPDAVEASRTPGCEQSHPGKCQSASPDESTSDAPAKLNPEMQTGS